VKGHKARTGQRGQSGLRAPHVRRPWMIRRWVALHGDDVLDADDDHDALIRRILDRPEEPIDVGLATENPAPRRIRLSSPVSVRRA